MMDNVVGRAMGQKMVEETCDEMLGANSQQKSVKGRRAVVNEVIPAENPLATQVAELTKQVKALTMQQQQ